ncbi:acetyltransferase [Microbacterium sp. SZ1]|uniref:GNAT family N-acetyltransferase n=1 Tax=Microbacterium sp. SZ1 TaxID=1849736 RepID=UPI000BBB884A|nr:GNAT family protein [Microbacterium sp. SZ1]PCE14363.1 acetyltransferase [Microbacterium sp. SZ1]
MEPVTLTTERLVLRAPDTSDVDAITEACQDPEIQRWTTVPSPYARSDAEEFVRLVGGWWAEGSETVWALRVDGALVGMIGLHDIAAHRAGGRAELGFWVTAAARGRGYVVEAARAVIDWGFTELGLARIEWRAVAGNVASAKAARSLGFRYEGLLRQAFASGDRREDSWVAGLLSTDDRTRVGWPVLD